MPLPRRVFAATRVALNSLYRELSLILERINGFWFRFFQLGAEGRRLAERQERNIRGVQSLIAQTLVALRWRIARAPTMLTLINKRMEDLTNADHHAYLKQFHPAYAIRQWDNSSIGQDINILDDIYLKWLDTCWMGIQEEYETAELAEMIPERIDDLIDIIKTIEDEPRSFEDWCSDIWALITKSRPWSYTDEVIAALKQAKQITDAIDCCRAIADAMNPWLTIINQGPQIERLKKWRWVGEGHRVFYTGFAERLEQDMALPPSLSLNSRRHLPTYCFHRDERNKLVAGRQVSLPKPEKRGLFRNFRRK